MTNKRRNHQAKICKATGKVSFSSEAKATRRMNKYDDIKRVYYCDECDGYHLTSESISETLENGVIDIKEENKLLHKKVNRVVDENNRLQKFERRAEKADINRRKVAFLINFISRSKYLPDSEKNQVMNNLKYNDFSKPHKA